MTKPASRVEPIALNKMATIDTDNTPKGRRLKGGLPCIVGRHSDRPTHIYAVQWYDRLDKDWQGLTACLTCLPKVVRR